MWIKCVEQGAVLAARLRAQLSLGALWGWLHFCLLPRAWQGGGTWGSAVAARPDKLSMVGKGASGH